MAEVKNAEQPAATKKKKTVRETAGKAATSKPAAAKKTSAKRASTTKAQVVAVSAAERHGLIAETAYLKAERRGFRGGDPVQDWLEAEKEVDASLAD
jgi:hypothetical protein